MNEQTFEVRDIRRKEKFVVDDLYLNGYARKVGVYATAVYLSLCRHSDKDQKSFPSRERIAEQHGISVRQVARAMQSLKEWNLIKVERIGKKANNRYWLVDKSEWTDSPFSDVPHSPVHRDSQSCHIGTDSPVHSKDTHKKDTHSKELAEQSSAGQVNPFIEKFKPVNPSYKRLFANKTQRSALQRLIDEIDPDKLGRIIDYLPKTNSKPYAPTITTPLQLEEKMGQLMAFVQKERINKKGIQSL